MIADVSRESTERYAPADQAKLQALRRALAVAEADLAAGRHSDLDDKMIAAIKARGRRRLAEFT